MLNKKEIHRKSICVMYIISCKTRVCVDKKKKKYSILIRFSSEKFKDLLCNF